MERKVGEIFEYNGEWYQCMEGTGCYRCAFNYDGNTCIVDSPYCICRSDKKNVIFKKLEKVGEPYEGEGKIFQPYQAYIIPVPKWDYEFFMLVHKETKIVDIEVKQNKENIEEKKLNFKPFDLEAAKAGKPVCTRNGRKVRILCYDLKGEEYPIVAAVETPNHMAESISAYDKNGRFDHGKENNNDLMMLPQKKEGWVNIYKDIDNDICGIYSTKEEALKGKSVGDYYVATIKIEWEE